MSRDGVLLVLLIGVLVVLGFLAWIMPSRSSKVCVDGKKITVHEFVIPPTKQDEADVKDGQQCEPIDALEFRPFQAVEKLGYVSRYFQTDDDIKEKEGPGKMDYVK